MTRFRVVRAPATRTVVRLVSERPKAIQPATAATATTPTAIATDAYRALIAFGAYAYFSAPASGTAPMRGGRNGGIIDA